MLVEITSHDQFLSAMEKSKQQLVISWLKEVCIDFSAEWCGPCKMISPVFKQLAEQESYKHVYFGKLDVDKVKESAQMAKITAMPTFQFYKGGKMIRNTVLTADEMKGANKAGLETILKKLAENSVSESASSKSAVIPGQMDLQQFVSNQLECLNSDNSHPIQNIFKPDRSLLKSDVDEQLILAISFNQPVKVHSLKIIAGENGPKTIKTFVNRISTLSFEDTESELAVDNITLTSDSLKPETAPTSLRYVKYQSVHHLTIFVQDNQDGSDITSIERLIIYGTPIEATKDVSELKKADGDQ